MIHLKDCFQKNLIKYGIIILMLFSTINVLFGLIKSVDISLSKEMNKVEYRTILIIDSDIEKINNIISKNKNIIKEHTFDNKNNQFTIIFNNFENTQVFLDEYENNLNNISIFSFNNDNYIAAKNVFCVIMILCLILIYSLIVLFTINIIYNLEQDIALYKLLGYSQNNIIKYFLIAIYVFYLIIYIISILLSILILKYVPFNDGRLSYISIIKYLSINNYIIIWLLISIIIVISAVRVILKIKKISPIKFIKSY